METIEKTRSQEKNKNMIDLLEMGLNLNYALFSKHNVENFGIKNG